MKYWPASVIAASPLMPEAYAGEAAALHVRGPSQGGYWACVGVARRTAPVEAPNLALVTTVEAPPRLTFIEYPSFTEWMALERVVFLEDCDGDIFGLVNAKH